MSTTPRTDAEMRGDEIPTAPWVSSAFAAVLETELAAFRAENTEQAEELVSLAKELEISFNAEELRQVRAENAELRRDKERLDWLESKSKFIVSAVGAHCGYHELPAMIPMNPYSQRTGATAGPTVSPATLRAAIDAARETAP